MKTLIWIVVLAAVVLGLYFLVSKPDTEEPVVNTDEQDMGETVFLEGTVMSINTDDVALDGPSLITVNTTEGERVVAVPSMGINLCAAKDDIADVFTISLGDTVSVSGEPDEEGRVVPCVDASHYLRAEPTSQTQTAS